MRSKSLAFLIVLAWAGTAAAQQVDYTLKVSPTTGTINDDFIVSVQRTIHGVVNPQREFPPDLSDFTVLDAQVTQRTQWSPDPTRGDEVMTVQVRSYKLRPNRVGKLRIGEARMILDGVEHKTNPLVVEVLPAGASVPADPNAADVGPGTSTAPDPSLAASSTFLHVIADKKKVYEGEQLTVTWLLYTRSDVLKFEPKPPKLDGFWVETLFEPQSYFNYHAESVGGREYAVAVVSKRALFPTKAGKVTIPPFEADASTLTYSPRDKPMHLKSPPVDVEVEPLPPGAPPNFDAAYVGNFTVEATVDRSTVAAGESLTLSLVVKGEGATRRAKIPTLELEGFQVTAPHDFDERIDTSSDVFKGERRYSYLVTPLRGGKLTLGPISIPTFSPQTGKFEAAHADPIPIAVLGDPAALGKPGAAGPASTDNIIDRDIRPAREEASVSSRVAVRFYRSPWFAPVLAAPLVLWILVVFGDLLRERLRRETTRARLRRARGQARRRLRQAEQHLRANHASKFWSEVARVITEQVGERVNEPVSALTRDQLRVLLDGRGFEAATVADIMKELEACDFARFAPSSSDPDEMRGALRRVRVLLGQIARVRPSLERPGVAA